MVHASQTEMIAASRMLRSSRHQDASEVTRQLQKMPIEEITDGLSGAISTTSGENMFAFIPASRHTVAWESQVVGLRNQNHCLPSRMSAVTARNTGMNRCNLFIEQHRAGQYSHTHGAWNHCSMDFGSTMFRLCLAAVNTLPP